MMKRILVAAVALLLLSSCSASKEPANQADLGSSIELVEAAAALDQIVGGGWHGGYGWVTVDIGRGRMPRALMHRPVWFRATRTQRGRCRVATFSAFTIG